MQKVCLSGLNKDEPDTVKRYSDTHLKHSADENSQHMARGKGEKGPQNSSRVIHERGSEFNWLPSPDSQISA